MHSQLHIRLILPRNAGEYKSLWSYRNNCSRYIALQGGYPLVDMKTNFCTSVLVFCMVSENMSIAPEYLEENLTKL